MKKLVMGIGVVCLAISMTLMMGCAKAEETVCCGKGGECCKEAAAAAVAEVATEAVTVAEEAVKEATK